MKGFGRFVVLLVSLLVGSIAISGTSGAIASQSVHPSVAGDPLWTARYNTPGDDSGNALVVSPDGTRVFATGHAGINQYGTIAYDATTGARIWQKRYGQLGSANAIGVSPDGGTVFVTGRDVPSSNDFGTVAYDADTGGQLWAKDYSGPAGGGFDAACALAVSPDGSTVVVTGESAGDTTDADYATVAYDASTGDQLWASRYNGPANDRDVPHSVQVSPDGTQVFVTGESRKSRAGVLYFDYATIAYDLATGTQQWVQRFDGPVKGDDSGYAVGVTPDGGTVFATGLSVGTTGTSEIATVAYGSATGARQWVNRYGPPSGAPYPDSFLSVSPDGAKVFVAATGAWFNYDYVAIAIDSATGARDWAKHYAGKNRDYADRVHGLAVSPDGGTVFLTGETYTNGPSDYETVAFDAADGTRLWVRRYDGPGHGGDAAHGLGVSPDGARVFVTGQSRGLGDMDYATIAYSTS
jgi:DNA-binding beta-propeller fold protein YncE